MPYIYLDKETKEFELYSNLPAIHQNKPINLDTLKYHFYRMKRNSYDKPEFKIVKVNLIRSKRK